MTKLFKSLSTACLAAGLGLSLAAAAHAQNQPGPPPREEGRGAHAWGQPGDMRARFEARRAQRAQLLHDALGLRSDQEGAWSAFMAEMKPPERADARMRHDDAVPLSAPERMDRAAARMGERQAAFQHRTDAVKRFYAALDERQRKTFDALVNLRLAKFGRGGGGFHRMG